ncbi:PucR family transcriptional regulator [Actinobacteria bacterium YIM 96077]|uniref:PucR family transcriptional regulator n=1 Tax=Phytoactinopolyspora halophila TaxID=1981511 RepID=A0A329QW92_9ACTN|nr:PucR family transcriptional regulator [Phytoactinopolyspora halophila]AYY15359.1 PucR family transcriptional regulator [Actinobacteria bacterium YIM 96077]RAW16527.1 PucR family transcriptional regulator [Phytoactinopolyspora halophila]
MPTIASLLADPALHLRAVVDGATGALEAPVRWVHNTELLDPSPYLRERELVMTNGLWRHDDGSAARFVENVVACGAAGIVFGLTEQTPRIPPELIEACRRVDLPLVELAIEVPFTELSRAVAAEYAEHRQHELAGLVRRGDALAETISRGAGLAGVLDVLERDHPELDVAVVDRMARRLAGTWLEEGDLEAIAAALARHPPPLDVELREGRRASLFLCGALGGADAALACLSPSSELGNAHRDALDQVARFVSLELARIELTQAIEMRFAGELIEMISSGTPDTDLVAERLEGFGIGAGDRLAVWSVASGDEYEGMSSGAPVDLAESIRRFFVDEGIPAVVASGSNDVVVIFPWRRADAEQEPLATRFVESARTVPRRERVVAGLGTVGSGIGCLRSSLFEAREACRVLRRRAAGAPVVRFAALGTHHLLLGLNEPATLRRFAKAVLDPIREHDRARGSELERTVRSFLDHDGQWSATATALHIHVNTLRNRLSRVTELTGRDVSRTEDRVDLFLAVRALDAVPAE